MKKIINYLSYLTIALAFGLIGLLFYWYLKPYTPLVLNNVTLDRVEVNRGEHIQISADYCKNINKPAIFYISFIDGLVYNPQPQVIDLEGGCHHTVLSIYIPKALPTGKYQLKGVFRYQVNPIRTIDVNHLSGEFNILK